MAELLFSYGTLRDSAIQERVIGRTVETTPDSLLGYRHSYIYIDGEWFPLIVPKEGEAIEGAVLTVTEDELKNIDAYETDAYIRTRIKLRSRAEAWVYVARDGPTRVDTLVIVCEGGNVLLGMKKRGFGAGNWNGFGGKVQSGETIVKAAHRELGEEAGIQIRTLTERGVLHFSFAHDPTLRIECHVFEGVGIVGTPSETEEMRPEWFAEDTIPYDRMWKDDTYWLPKFLRGESFVGIFHFDENGSIIRGMLNGQEY